MGDRIVGLVWAIGAMVLVVSSLAARRLPVGRTVTMALAWAAIFAVAFAIFRLIRGHS